MFGLAQVVRSESGYEATTEGTSGRTLYLVCDSYTERASGFVQVTFDQATPSPFILPVHLERRISDLERLVATEPKMIGMSPCVASIRLPPNIYQMLLRETVDNVVHHHKHAKDHIHKAVDAVFKTKRKQVLPTPNTIICAMDPDWRPLDNTRLHIDDIFKSRFANKWISKRRVLLNRGAAVLDVSQFTVRELITLYFEQCCSPAMEDYVRHIERTRGVLPVEKEIYAVVQHFRGKKIEQDERMQYGHVTLESAPPCIHKYLGEPLVDLPRMNLAKIMAVVMQERNLPRDAFINVVMERIAHLGNNKHRLKDIRVRITSEAKSSGKLVDPIRCRMRHAGSQLGIKCPLGSPDLCLAQRQYESKLLPSDITVSDVWLYSNPRSDGPSMGGAPNE